RFLRGVVAIPAESFQALYATLGVDIKYDNGEVGCGAQRHDRAVHQILEQIALISAITGRPSRKKGGKWTRLVRTPGQRYSLGWERFLLEIAIEGFKRIQSQFHSFSAGLDKCERSRKLPRPYGKIFAVAKSNLQAARLDQDWKAI